MRWTNEQLEAYQARRAASGAKPQQVVRDEPVAEEKREAPNANRIRVRIEGFRRRLLDPDNLCPKYFVDCLRYCGFISDDRDQDITLEVSQTKVKTKAEERTEITVTGAVEMAQEGQLLPSDGKSE